MNPIPVLGIPHYNRPDLTARCIASIDYPVGKLVLVVNSENSISELGLIQRELAARMDAGLVKSTHIITHPNAGVAGAWNEIIKLFPAPWWLISNNDIEFAPGDLKKMAAFVGQGRWYVCGECQQRFTAMQFNTNAGYCSHCAPVNAPSLRVEKYFLKESLPGLIYGNHGASWFGITAACVTTAGLFDENIYPAYLEDCDYAHRCNLLNVVRCNVPGVVAKHGCEPHGQIGELTGSCTIHSDAALLKKNGRTHGGNFDYYRAKWGGINGEEKYTHPFNTPQWPVWAWKFDPAFRARQQW